jgi:hypothetical protein
MTRITSPVTNNVHLGWCIAGNVVSPTDMPTSKTASYSGDVIGNVASLQQDGWTQYVATGDMDMSWDIRKRSGELSITQFDGDRSFSGTMVAPGKNPFGGIWPVAVWPVLSSGASWARRGRTQYRRA